MSLYVVLCTKYTNKICLNQGVNVRKFSNNYVLHSQKIAFTLANSADPDEMSFLRHFLCVFTVCQISPIGVSSIQRVEQFANPLH